MGYSIKGMRIKIINTAQYVVDSQKSLTLFKIRGVWGGGTGGGGGGGGGGGWTKRHSLLVIPSVTF